MGHLHSGDLRLPMSDPNAIKLICNRAQRAPFRETFPEEAAAHIRSLYRRVDTAESDQQRDNGHGQRHSRILS